MKSKNIIPIVVGGILGAGVAVFSCCKIRKLKNIVADQDELIKSYENGLAAAEELIDIYKEAIREDKNVIAEKDKLIAELQLKAEDHTQQPTTDQVGEYSQKPQKPSSLKQLYYFQYDADFNVIGKFASAREACDKVGLKYISSITKVTRGEAYTAAGYFWSRGRSPLKKIPDKWKAFAQEMKGKQ